MTSPSKKIKIAPPPDNEPTLNVTGKNIKPDTIIKPIQIKVSINKHKKMKIYAAEQGITITDMLLAGYEMYKNKMK
uniref:Uncharacterized protein n=1 Tax=Arsenophonus endosymbiont of Trialeurodes vaporariorum TaxID=235567 RepID=A0A3B0MMN1_9GAMM